MPLQATSGAASYDGFGGGVPAAKNYIEDVFSTYLYTGNGSTQTITNGIDLSTKGGLVWIKDRTAANSNVLFDTARGANNRLISNLTNAQSTETDAVTSFNTNGFSIGASAVLNTSSNNLASWTFRKQPKFFDVVTYTGDGTAGKTVSHNLGSVPGCIIVKRTDSTANWAVQHRSLTADGLLFLNSTAANNSGASGWNSTEPTSTQFTVGTNAATNASGATYVAYLFASNAGGFGLTGTDNVISCGSYTHNSTSGVDVNLGYEPQWILQKNAGAASGWLLIDNMRGWVVDANDQYLTANSSGVEDNIVNSSPTATGFKVDAGAWGNGANIIYIAIRRGPMKVPTSGTSVFSPNAIGAVSVGTPVTTNFPVDLQIATWRGGTSSHYFYDRLRGVSSTTTEGAKSLLSDSTAAETSPTTATRMWGNTGYQVDTSWSNSVSIFHNFRRAPSFFDEVCYTGTGSARTINHNLGVVPELMIVKQRSAIRDWSVYSASTGATNALYLNTTAASSAASIWNSTAPTSSVFSLAGLDSVNASGGTFVAYLFATCAGVSKVGSYTGNGSTQTINCGFTGGARFVLIKRTDSTGDWYVWDTARGIIAANDPHLSLNTTAAEVTTDDTIDTDSTGFVVNQVAATNVNVTSATYIFLAIA